MRVPKGYSYMPGPLAVARHRVDLGAGGLGRADAGPPGAAVQRDVRRGAEGLDVVDHGRLAQVAAAPPGTAGGCAACRACLPAIRSATTPRRTRRRRRRRGCRCRSRSPAAAGWPCPAARRRAGAAARPAAARAGSGIRRAGRPGPGARRPRSAAMRHALEHRVGVAGEQHAVLEGAGLAFVGVADHDVLAARRLRGTAAHLSAGGKAGAAAPAQVASASSRPASPSAPRASAAASAAPGARRRRPAARRRGGCCRRTSNHCGRPLRHRHAARGSGRPSAPRAPASSRVTTWWWLTSSAGPWSHRPVQEVRSTLTRPSSRELARRHAQAAAQVGHQRLRCRACGR